ncbi:unnamed protein product [Macrosiphum euphorbiae]|uniref:Uncharacterized protein n=1 Tax=Macrosiphum euphorbiae TaxID=13131 RepID=A0AAV0WPV6_9HEMI|nr:unnamed protein product [Macrosiphum euphorbiae]
MFPVQIFVVLSMMIIINQAALTLNYQQSNPPFTPEFDKTNTGIIKKKLYLNGNGHYSDVTSRYDFILRDLLKNSHASLIPDDKKWCYGPYGKYIC